MPSKERVERVKFWKSVPDHIEHKNDTGCNDDLKARGLLGTNYVYVDPITGEVYKHDKHAGGESHNKGQHDKKMQTAHALKIKHADIWDERGKSKLIQEREAKIGNDISPRTIRSYIKLLKT